LPQATRAAAAIRVANRSDFFISSFLLWVEQFPEIVSAAGWQLMTERQGLELLLLNLKL
jgi:hypothetical protein